jgi:hypothetical protein
MYGEGYSEFMDYGAAPLMLSQTLVMVRLQECLLDLLEGQEIKMLILTLWCRKWPMFCKINSA